MRVDQLSDDQVAKVRQFFNAVDKNGDGTISAREFDALLRAFSVTPNLGAVRDRFKTADGGGALGFGDFLEGVALHFDQRAWDWFVLVDRNSDGKITVDECQQALAAVGKKATRGEAEQLIAEADIDGDGEVTYQEFVRYLIDSA